MKTKNSYCDPTSAPTFWINHASRLLMREFELRLRPLDFGMAYLPVVMSIKENGPLSQKDLALAAHVEQPTMAALLDRMERDLLVQREPHPKDKRASLISLTAKAKARIPSAKEGLEDVAEQALSGFSDREKTLLVTLLKRMVSNLDQSSKD